MTIGLWALGERPLWAATPVVSMRLEVQTADVTFAGTDNDVELVLLVQKDINPPEERRWNLDSPGNDFEEGNLGTYDITTNLPEDVCHIIGIGIHKAPDDFDGGWKLDWFKLRINNADFYLGNVYAWLEDDSRDWWAADFTNQMCDPGFTFGGPTPLVPPLPNCKVGTGSVEFGTAKPDDDCDGIPNDVDKEFKPPDTDGDGLPDRTEDWNGNGVVDPGESDPYTFTKLSDLPDADGDGLPDLFEDRDRDGIVDPGETNRTNPDTDGDGWADGPKNLRTRLYLVRVECLDSSEDTELGDDEPFVTFNHTRWPHPDSLSDNWELGDDDSVSPMIEAARRTRGMAPLGPWKVRVDLREEDWFDWTDDDFQVDRDHEFPESGYSEFPYLDDGWFNVVEYKLRFVSVAQMFADPHPLDPNPDDDADGLTERQEFQMAAELRGVADPTLTEIYMELDVFGDDQAPERYSKEDICTLFARHQFAFHLDDGTFGGGDILPYQEEMTLSQAGAYRNTHMAASRQKIFHYAVGVDVPKHGGNSKNGRALRIKKDSAGNWLEGNGNTLIWKTDFLDHVSDFESIVWVHEFGHNLGLCHRPGDDEATAVGPGGPGGCTLANHLGDCNCAHYLVSDSSETAMGSSGGLDALDREIDYDPAEWPVIDLRHIGK